MTTRRRLWWATVGTLALLGGCADDPNEMYFTGEAAPKRLRGYPIYPIDRLPASATDFRYYEGGTFNGLNQYLTYTCGSVDDCYRAVEVMGGPKRDEFGPWHPSPLNVIMDGPRYGDPAFDPKFWPIRTITNGVLYERVWGTNALTYHAIDMDRHLVFYQRSSGGFDAGPPKGR